MSYQIALFSVCIGKVHNKINITTFQPFLAIPQPNPFRDNLYSLVIDLNWEKVHIQIIWQFFLYAHPIFQQFKICFYAFPEVLIEKLTYYNSITFIFDHQPVELWLQFKVSEEEMNAASRLRDNQPHTVQVVPILLGVVWGQYSPGWRREVEETWNYKQEATKEQGRKERGQVDGLLGTNTSKKSPIGRNDIAKRKQENNQHKHKDLGIDCVYLQVQLGLLPDHWLLCWHVMVFSPTSSKADWQKKVNTSPCWKRSPLRRPNAGTPGSPQPPRSISGTHDTCSHVLMPIINVNMPHGDIQIRWRLFLLVRWH